MPLEADKAFDSYLDDEYPSVRLKFLGGPQKPSEVLRLVDPTAYQERRQEWLEKELGDALGEGNELGYFDTNRDRFRSLVAVAAKGRLLPLVGAGLSASCGFPTWASFLERVAKERNIRTRQVIDGLRAEEFELVAAELAATLKLSSFNDCFERAFGKPLSAGDGDVVRTLLSICTGPVVTTNYDKVLEQLLAHEWKDVFKGRQVGYFLRLAREGQRVLWKIHGDLNVPESRVLTKSEYGQAYDDPASEIPGTLSSVFLSHPVLFVGCSLAGDRTMAVLKAISTQTAAKGMFHYAIVEAPSTNKELHIRNAFLEERCVFPVWYERNRHERVGELLRQIKVQVDEQR